MHSLKTSCAADVTLMLQYFGIMLILEAATRPDDTHSLQDIPIVCFTDFYSQSAGIFFGRQHRQFR